MIMRFVLGCIIITIGYIVGSTINSTVLYFAGVTIALAIATPLPELIWGEKFQTKSS